MKQCAVCTLGTQSLWNNIPVCVECRNLGKLLMVEEPHMNMRQALQTTREYFIKGLDFAIQKAEEEEADAMDNDSNSVRSPE